MVIVNYFMVIATVVGLVFSLFQWQPPQSNDWYILAVMGLVGFTAQYCMTRALQLAEARLITPFKYVEVLGTVLVGFLIFGEHQTKFALTGIAIIVLSLLLNVWIGTRSKRTRP